MRTALKVLGSVPFAAVSAMLHHTYKRTIPFRKPATEIPEFRQRRSLWIFNFSSYQIAGYDLVSRMRALLLALIIAWFVFVIGLMST